MKRIFHFIACILLPAVMLGAPQKPNVLFIITDQQFADAMSCRMGSRYIHTPVLDGLARDGMFFTRAYSANPLCMPSRNSMFTGRYPHETRVTRNNEIKLDPAEFVDLGACFQRAGYQTAYFGKRHLFFNVEKSFPITINPPMTNHDIATAASAVDFLSQKHDQPFLLVVSFKNPHNVCELSRGQDLPDGEIGAPPPPENCPPLPANFAPQQDEPDTMTIMRKGYQASPLFPVGNYTEAHWRQLRWGYCRLIEKVDAQIGEVLGALRRAGLEDNTIVVFTSDHGECAGAHDFIQKTVLYEESARVPLIISFKGRAKAGLCDKLVNTGVDIMPTLLDFAGAPVPPKLTGRSLRPLALGQPAADWRDFVVVEDDMDQAGPVDGFTPSALGRMVRTDRYKYCIYSRGLKRESLVDLQTDPDEAKNLAGDPAFRAILLEHRALLARFAKEHNDPQAIAMLADDVKPVPFRKKKP
ncbi:MAG TPA: sulfatase-like hydrolase/transferase [Verrucomicrobiae bacterium]